MKILALDLATKTGWASNASGLVVAGTWVLASASEIKSWGKSRQTRTKDPRINRLCERLSSLDKHDIVVIEDVQFSSYVLQVQLWSALRSAVWLCGKGDVFEAVSVGTLKKFATGNGGADKDAMARYLRDRHPEIWTPQLDDNAIDAAWIWVWAKETFKRMNQSVKPK